MQRPPPSIAVIGWLFVVSGAVMIGASVFTVMGTPSSLNSSSVAEEGLAFVVRVLALVGGVFLLRGSNWARWLLVIWIGYHVALSLFHPLFELVVHGLLLITTVYVLFRRPASAFFRSPTVLSPEPPNDPPP